MHAHNYYYMLLKSCFISGHMPDHKNNQCFIGPCWFPNDNVVTDCLYLVKKEFNVTHIKVACSKGTRLYSTSCHRKLKEQLSELCLKTPNCQNHIPHRHLQTILLSFEPSLHCNMMTWHGALLPAILQVRQFGHFLAILIASSVLAYR